MQKKRNVSNSPRLLELKRNRKKTLLNKIIFFLVGVLAIFIFAAYISRLSSLNISNIKVFGNQIVDTTAITQTIQSEMSGHYLWLFPKTNIFLYPQSTIKQALEDKFKRLVNINLVVKNTKDLEVSVSERKAMYTWCGNVPTSDQTCYFVDENGYIFDQAPNFSGGVYFKFYGTPDGNASNPSGSYFNEEYFKKLVSFKDILVEFGLKLASLYVTNDGDVKVYLASQAQSTNQPQIVFKLNGNYDNIAENLEAAITTEPLKTEFANKYSTLEYIDLRFGNKVFYKFKSGGVITQ